MPKFNELPVRYNTNSSNGIKKTKSSKGIISTNDDTEVFKDREGGAIETYMTPSMVANVKRMFCSEERYLKHMETLWKLRAYAGKSCEIDTPRGSSYDMNSPFFRIWNLCNELIGALLNDEYTFTFDGLRFSHYKRMTRAAIDDPKTYLDNKNIRLLLHVMPNEVTYISNMETLTVLLYIVREKYHLPEAWWTYDDYDESKPHYMMADLLQELIYVFDNGNMIFDFDGKNITHRRSRIVWEDTEDRKEVIS